MYDLCFFCDSAICSLVCVFCCKTGFYARNCQGPNKAMTEGPLSLLGGVGCIQNRWSCGAAVTARSVMKQLIKENKGEKETLG